MPKCDFNKVAKQKSAEILDYEMVSAYEKYYWAKSLKSVIWLKAAGTPNAHKRYFYLER